MSSVYLKELCHDIRLDCFAIALLVAKFNLSGYTGGHVVCSVTEYCADIAQRSKVMLGFWLYKSNGNKIVFRLI